MSDGKSIMEKTGNFLLLPNIDVTKHVNDVMLNQPQALIDLIDICLKWYNKDASKMHNSISIYAQNASCTKPV